MHQSIFSSCVCPGDPKEILHLKQVTQRQQECREMQWDNIVCCALLSKSLQTTMDSDTIRYFGGFALCARKRFPDCFLPSMSSASAWRTFESYAQGLVRSVQFRIVGNFGILDMILVFSTLLGSKSKLLQEQWSCWGCIHGCWTRGGLFCRQYYGEGRFEGATGCFDIHSYSDYTFTQC